MTLDLQRFDALDWIEDDDDLAFLLDDALSGADASDLERVIALTARQGVDGGRGRRLCLSPTESRSSGGPLKAGGHDNGPPGLRPNHGPNYCAAFTRDGFNIEAVRHAPE